MMSAKHAAALAGIALFAAGCVSSSRQPPVPPAAAPGQPTVKRINSDGAGGLILPDGTRVVTDSTGGFTLPNGDYVRRDASGALNLPNGSRCAPSSGGYVCP